MSAVRNTVCAVAVATSVLSACGCQGPLKPIFEEVKPPLTWPADPARAKIRYVGSLTSSADLKARRTFAQGLADFFAGAEEPVRLSGPRAVVTTRGGGRVWIADPGGRCLHVFDLQDRSHRKIVSAGEDRLLSPSGLCAGPNDTVFVCDSEAATIYQLSESSGALVRTIFPTDDLERPVALHYDRGRAELYVVDVAAHNIKVLDHDGRVVRVLGRRGSEPGEFNFPCDIAGDDSVIWVADAGNQRIQGLTHRGEFVASFGEAGDAPGQMALPKSVATDSEGHVYVVDARFENVQIFDKGGNLLLIIGEEGADPGQFWLPAGIFIDPNDRIWICDTYNRRVQVFDRVRTVDAGGEQ